MLFVLSPAKALDYETPQPEAWGDALPHTTPKFVAQSQALVEVLSHKSVQEVAELMDLSDKLAALNVARYAAWRPRFTVKNSRQSILAFNGDVYEGYDARSLVPSDLLWAQDHLCILSGLYGVLRPLDLMQPYRLEMGTRLATPVGSNLYQYWGSQIAEYLNQRQKKDRHPVLVNLASQEYFKAVDRKALRARVVECVFEECKAGQYKVISFMAKRARGLMARYATVHRLTEVEALQRFDLDGYSFDAVASQADRYVFRRKAS